MGRKPAFLFDFLVLIAIATACRDPFEPEVTDADLGILVVEGFIETNGAESKITLSRTAPISQTDLSRPEMGASLRLVSETGEMWQFAETAAGEYKLAEILDNYKVYELSISLPDGSEFKSKPMKPIVSPEIEEVGFLRDEFGVEIFLSTQGNEEAEYFLWEYKEHWIFFPGVISFLKFEKGQVSTRGEDERIDRCWTSNIFPKIILQDAARFENNTILQRELVRIPNMSEKLSRRYSIEITQRALDREAYDFWEILRKNSDDIGGIFSPLPSILKSNIIPAEGTVREAIGHISIGQSSSKRIYINNADVAPWRVFIPEYEFCIIFPDTIPPNQAALAFNNDTRVPAREIWDGPALLGYHASTKQCTDCTLRGTNKAPDFWEN